MSSADSSTEFQGVGNTIPPPKKQIPPAKHWCFTLNNWTDKEKFELIEVFSSNNLNKWVIGEEVGEEGTPHLQGYIEFEKKMRPLSVCSNKRIHWEKCKGNPKQNIDYCTKDGKYVKSANIKVTRKLVVIENLKPWQAELELKLLEDPNDRTITWVYEETGGVGKSSFCKYLIVKHAACYLSEGKKSDLLNIVYNYVEQNGDLLMLVVDVPRANGNNVSYKALEDIKNGIIQNTKYETGTRIINACHVLVFSNQYPEVAKLSGDRWEIYEIVNDELEKRTIINSTL